MIIKKMLDELLEQIKEISYFDNMEIYKVTNNMHASLYYRHCENKNDNLLNELNNLAIWKKILSRSIATQQFVLTENRNYSDDLINVSSYIIPVVFRNEVVFLVNMISFNKATFCTQKERKDIEEVVYCFEEFFCLREMAQKDMIKFN